MLAVVKIYSRLSFIPMGMLDSHISGNITSWNKFLKLETNMKILHFQSYISGNPITNFETLMYTSFRSFYYVNV